MKIEKINYQRAYVTGPFLQDKMGMEISIDTDRGETPEAAYAWAKEIMDNWHKANNPHLEGTTVVENNYRRNPIQEMGPGPTLGVQPERPADTKEALIRDIESCKEVKILESYRLLAKSNPEFQAAYNQKMNELTQKQKA